MSEAQPDISKMTFEAALAELEAIVEKLEAGKVSLEDSIAIYERCDKLLKAAEARIEKITLKADGSAGGTEPLDVE
jgi:exodeoxyribonuclease VII small subunit